MNKLLKIPGSKLLFGSKPLDDHFTPEVYGAFKPTAVFVPFSRCLIDNFDLVTKEIFGTFQVVTEYRNDELELVLEASEMMHAHLIAAVVSNDPLFLQLLFSCFFFFLNKY